MKKVFVTQPVMPNKEKFLKYIDQIWENKLLTNRGPFLQELEEELAEYLGLEEIILTANATLALMLSMKALNLSGDVITTPFTFTATANAIVWAGLNPVFADIEVGGVNICARSAEQLVNPKTSAILAVHCYGIPCNHSALDELANRCDLKLIYDACHCFGTDINERSILQLGDISVLSLHATKLFSTVEGGLIYSPDKQKREKIRSLLNFGFRDEFNIDEVGINAKMSELHAAFGLANIKNISSIFEARKQIYHRYQDQLTAVSELSLIARPDVTRDGISYVPIILNSSAKIGIEELKRTLESEQIYTRRYFYPLLNNTKAYTNELGEKESYPNAEQLSERILCLPIYPDLNHSEVDTICDKIISSVR